MASIKVAAMMLLGMLLLASVSYAQDFEQPQFGESGDSDIAPITAEPEAAAAYGFDAVGPQDMMAQRRRLQTFGLFRRPYYSPFFYGGFNYGFPYYGGYPYGFNYGGFPGASATAAASVTPGSASASSGAVGGK